MSKLLEKLLSSVSSTLKAPVCKSTVLLDLRGHHIRTTESAAGNWFADIIRPAYDDTLAMNGCEGADGVFICAGTLRGDSTYGPGVITLGDILEILPFEDPAIVIEMDGETLWEALEAGLSKWPAQEGRFPVISGFKVTWDSRREPGNRVTGVWLQVENVDKNQSHGHVDHVPVEKTKEGRKYRIVTREYLADGHDGYDVLKRCKRLVDEECGVLVSAIVRKYLLGSHYVNKMIRLKSVPNGDVIHPKLRLALSEESSSKARIQWRNVVHKVINRKPFAHYRHQQNVPAVQHMSSVDAFDGSGARKGEPCPYAEKETTQDLLVISPEIDGRLKDEARSD
ncbi:flagellar associated protein [Coprinopsis cinerea AmutBmut pab1-1]|nr:flagellar associated protein [Coprinopsis cinerea AmutBmut pab1-1]